MVMEFAKEGSLREYLTKNHKNLKWKDKLSILSDIITGLHTIHDGGLIHRDFHSGNILMFDGNATISDLGLSIPSQQNQNVNNGGVLPYVS